MWDVLLHAMNKYSFHWLIKNHDLGYGKTEWSQMGKSNNTGEKNGRAERDARGPSIEQDARTLKVAPRSPSNYIDISL